MSTDLATIDTDDAKALAVNAERARMMAGGRDTLPRQYRDNPAALLVAFEYADALGVPRISALTGVHIVDGKPTASADLIGALVRKAGHKLRVKGDETYAEAVIIRADDPDFIPDPIRWDLDRAKRAGLLGKKGPWQTYPGAMMRARAITEAARMWASEALFGVIYSPEELGAPVDESGQVIEGSIDTDPPKPAPPQQESASLDVPAKPVELIDADNMLDAFAACDNLDDLTALAGSIKGRIPDDRRDELLSAYQTRRTALENPEPHQDSEPEPSEQQTLDGAQ